MAYLFIDDKDIARAYTDPEELALFLNEIGYNNKYPEDKYLLEFTDNIDNYGRSFLKTIYEKIESEDND